MTGIPSDLSRQISDRDEDESGEQLANQSRNDSATSHTSASLLAHYLLNVEIALATRRRHISHFLPLYRREPLPEASICS